MLAVRIVIYFNVFASGLAGTVLFSSVSVLRSVRFHSRNRLSVDLLALLSFLSELDAYSIAV